MTHPLSYQKFNYLDYVPNQIKFKKNTSLASFHITSEEFDNAALFLRLGLPSTLIRHENGALFLRLGLPSTLIRHENRALLLRLGLPSTLESVTKTELFKPEEFLNARFSFLCGRKTFRKRSFTNTMVSRYWWDFDHRILLKLRRSVDGQHLMRFHSETFVFLQRRCGRKTYDSLSEWNWLRF